MVREAYVESLNSRLRDECPNINSFYSLLHAQIVIGDWKTEYNHDRRHSSLGYLAPVHYARQCTPSIGNRRLAQRPDRMKGAAQLRNHHAAADEIRRATSGTNLTPRPGKSMSNSGDFR